MYLIAESSQFRLETGDDVWFQFKLKLAKSRKKELVNTHIEHDDHKRVHVRLAILLYLEGFELLRLRIRYRFSLRVNSERGPESLRFRDPYEPEVGDAYVALGIDEKVRLVIRTSIPYRNRKTVACLLLLCLH